MRKLVRVIDRRNNRHYEPVEDAKIGGVARHKDEPLSEHVADRDLRRKGHTEGE